MRDSHLTVTPATLSTALVVAGVALLSACSSGEIDPDTGQPSPAAARAYLSYNDEIGSAQTCRPDDENRSATVTFDTVTNESSDAVELTGVYATYEGGAALESWIFEHPSSDPDEWDSAAFEQPVTLALGDTSLVATRWLLPEDLAEGHTETAIGVTFQTPDEEELRADLATQIFLVDSTKGTCDSHLERLCP